MRVLFISLTDDVGTDRLVADLGRAGAACAVLGPAGCVAALPRCVSARFALPSGLRAVFDLKRALRHAVDAFDPQRIIPLDDLAATLLRTFALGRGLAPGVRKLLITSLGSPHGYAAACGRVALMRVAQDAGVRVPPFFGTHGFLGKQNEAVPLPVMVKRDQSSGSGGVVRAGSHRAVASAIRRGWLKSALKAQAARLAGLGRSVTPVLVQASVEGRLAMHTVVCRDGVVIDGAGFVAVESHPTKGSSTILRHLENPEMAESARRVVAALGCSGFVSFDFILDDQGRAHLIEMNPRPIGSAHLGRRFGHDLAHAYLAGSPSGEGADAGPVRDVALFPKELERDPSGRRLDGSDVLHDVPAHEPAVIAAYLDRLQAEHPAYAAGMARRCGIAESTLGTSPLPTAHPEPA